MKIIEISEQEEERIINLIGEKVLGWHHDDTRWFEPAGNVIATYTNDFDYDWPKFQPTSDMNDAWRIVIKLGVSILPLDNPEFITPDSRQSALLICEAALIKLGIEYN